MGRDLTTSEGVDEGSAASSTEEASGGSPSAGPGPTGRPAPDEDPAPPLGEIGAGGSGQELALGEG